MRTALSGSAAAIDPSSALRCPSAAAQALAQLGLCPEPALASALAARALAAAPSLSAYETPGLLRGVAALGAPGTCDAFLLHPADPRMRSALRRACEGGKPAAAAALLWAMSRWVEFPEPLLAGVAGVLEGTSPGYGLRPSALRTLGEALRALPPGVAHRVRLHPRLRRRAEDAADGRLRDVPRPQALFARESRRRKGGERGEAERGAALAGRP